MYVDKVCLLRREDFWYGEVLEIITVAVLLEGTNTVGKKHLATGVLGH